MQSPLRHLLFFLSLSLVSQLGLPQPSAASKPEVSWEDRVTRELMAKISDWAGTWQAQLPDLYIAHYTLDYVAPGFSSREAWLKDRREKLIEPEQIKLRLLDFELVTLTRTEAVTRFTLIYERPGYADKTYKELTITNRNGLWLIAKENNLSVSRI